MIKFMGFFCPWCVTLILEYLCQVKGPKNREAYSFNINIELSAPYRKSIGWPDDARLCCFCSTPYKVHLEEKLLKLFVNISK